MLRMFLTLYFQYADQPQEDEGLEGTMDAAEALDEELAAIKHASKDSRYRFKSVSSGARGVLFITCSPATDPHAVVHNMFSDILQQHKRKARYMCTFSIACVYACMACLHCRNSVLYIQCLFALYVQ